MLRVLVTRNNLRVRNVRQPENTHTQQPTVSRNSRRFLSIFHEQTSSPGVSYKWGDVGRGEEKNGGERRRGGEERNRFSFLPHPFPLTFSHSLAVSFPLRAFGNDRVQHRLPTVKNQRYARWKAKVPYVEHWTSKYVKSDVMKSNHFCCVIRPMVYFL